MLVEYRWWKVAVGFLERRCVLPRGVFSWKKVLGKEQKWLWQQRPSPESFSGCEPLLRSAPPLRHL